MEKGDTRPCRWKVGCPTEGHGAKEVLARIVEWPEGLDPRWMLFDITLLRRT